MISRTSAFILTLPSSVRERKRSAALLDTVRRAGSRSSIRPYLQRKPSESCISWKLVSEKKSPTRVQNFMGHKGKNSMPAEVFCRYTGSQNVHTDTRAHTHTEAYPPPSPSLLPSLPLFPFPSLQAETHTQTNARTHAHTHTCVALRSSC